MSYACKDRSPFKEHLQVQDGYFMDGVTRIQKMISIPFRMALECVYQADDRYNDPQCRGCKHKVDHK